MIFRGRRSARGSGLVVLAALAALMIAGCQHGGVVTVSTAAPPTSSAEPSGATGGAAYALLPRAARAHTYAGGQAFAEFYVEQVNRAGAPIDPDVLRAFGMPSCAGCTQAVQTAARLRAQSQRYSAAAVRLTPASGLPDSAPKADAVVLDVVGDALPVHVLGPSGAKVATTPHGRLNLEFCLEWDAGRWQVSSLQGGVAG